MNMELFGTCERNWATMHARPSEHNNADHNPGRRNAQGDKKKDKKNTTPEERITYLETNKKTEDDFKR